MAIASVGTLSSPVSSTSSNTLVATGVTAAVNSLLVYIIVSDNTSTTSGNNNEVTSVTDTAGNTWVKAGERTNAGTAASTVVTSVWYAKITSALSSGSVTANFVSNRTDKAGRIWRFTMASNMDPQVDAVTYNELDASTGFGSAAISGLTSASRLWIRGCGKEANSTTSLTVTTNFTSISATRSRNNTNAVMAMGEFRITTATNLTSNPTHAVSGDSASVFVAISETPAKSLITNIVTPAKTGEVWSQLSASGGRYWKGIATSFDNTKIAAIVQSSNVFTSDDSGQTWFQQTGSGSHSWQGIASSDDGSIIVAVQRTGESSGSVHKSTDSGLNWTDVSSISAFNGYSKVDMSADGNVIAITSGRAGETTASYVAVSTNSGTNWSYVGGGGSMRLWRDVAVSSDGSTMYAVVWNGGIWKTTDYGVNWTQLSASYGFWNSVSCSGDGSIVVATKLNDYVYTSSDGGTNWTQRDPLGATAGWEFSDISRDGTMMMVSMLWAPSGNGVSVSDDGGATWTTNIPIAGSTDRYVGGFSFSNDGSSVIFVEDEGGTAYRSDEIVPTTYLSFSPTGTLYTPNSSSITFSATGTLTGVGKATNNDLIWAERVSSGVRYWRSIASSTDGTKLAAVNDSGYIYTSTDSGATWTEQTGSGSRDWVSITSSADGTKLAAAVNGGSIYTSTDSGVNWILRTGGSGAWESITSSSDGTKLAAAAFGGYIWTSTDSGAAWTERTSSGSRYWYSITSSADGTKLAAVTFGGYVYTSSDSGATWTERAGSGSRNWQIITSSADGTKLAAGVPFGYIYTSTDSGVTWTERTGAGSRGWGSITSSADGTKLAVVVYNGYIYTSTDSGATWTEQTGSGSRTWQSITSSSDGAKLAAGNSFGYIYTSAPQETKFTFTPSASITGFVFVDGSSSLTFTSTGLLKANVVGSSAITFASTSALVANGRLIGASPFTFAATATGRRWAYFIGSSSLTFASTSSLKGAGPLGGSTALSFATTAVIGGNAIGVASSILNYTTLGTIEGTANAVGSSSIAFDTILDSYTVDPITNIVSADWQNEKIRSVISPTSNFSSSSDGVHIVVYDQITDTILVSNNAGETWTTATVTSPYFNGVHVSSDGSKISIIANEEDGVTNASLRHSSDYGATWSSYDVGVMGAYGLKGSSNGSVLLTYDGYNDGYLTISTDFGTTWATILNEDIAWWDEPQWAVAGNGSKIAVSDNNNVYVSSDNGTTWSSNPVPVSSYNFVIALTNDGSKIYGANSDFIYYSIDDGANWTPLSDSETSGVSVAQIAVSDDEAIALYTDSAQNQILIYTGSDLVEFQSKNNSSFGYPPMQFLEDNRLMYLWTGSIELSNNDYTDYETLLGSRGVNISPFNTTVSKNNRALYYTNFSTSISRSINYGRDWDSLQIPDSFTALKAGTSADGSKIVVLAFGPNPFFKMSNNFGNTWFNIEPVVGESYSWKDIAIGANTMAALSNSTNTVYISYDSGATWEPIPDTDTQTWNDVEISGDDQIIILTSTTTITYSSDGGATWDSVSMSEQANQITMSENGTAIYVQTWSGATLWRSIDRAQSWEEIDVDFPLGRLYVSPTGDALVSSGGGRISKDTGTTWSIIPGIGDVFSCHALVYGPDYLDMLTEYAEIYEYEFVVDSTKFGFSETAEISQIGYITNAIENFTWSSYGLPDSPWKLIAASDDGQTIVVGGQYTPIYISTNGGATWVSQEDLGEPNWTGIAVSSNGSKIVVCYGNGGGNGGLHISNDGGATWEVDILVNRNLTSLAMSADGSTIYVVGEGEYIWGSTDGGSLLNWSVFHAAGIAGWLAVDCSSDGSRAIASSYNNGAWVYNAVDGWTQFSSTIYTSVYTNDDGSTLIAGEYNNALSISNDNGVTWTPSTTSGSAAFWSPISSSADGKILLATPADGGGGSVYLKVSYDYGATWSDFGAAFNPWGYTDISPDGKKFYAVVNEGPVFSLDRFTYPTSLIFDGEADLVSSTTLISNTRKRWLNNGIKHQTYEGTPYMVASENGQVIVRLLQDNNGDVNLVQLSTDGGSTWTIKTPANYSASFEGVYLNGVLVSADGTTIKLFDENMEVMFLSSDSGATWNEVEQTSPHSNYTSSYDTEVIAAENNDGRVEISTDGGESWETVLAGSPRGYWRNAASSDDGTKILAVTGSSYGYPYISSDSGATWTQSYNFNNWRDVAMSSSGTMFYAVSANAVHMSPDGINWPSSTSFGTNMRSIACSSDGVMAAAVQEGGYIWISADSGSNWTLRASYRFWLDVAMSTDGTRLAAVESSGFVWTSDDSGVTWTQQNGSGNSGGSRDWYRVAMSDDGSKIVAAGIGNIFTSDDYGVTWNERSVGMAANWFGGIDCSADGNKIIAVPFSSGPIAYISDDFGLTWDYIEVSTIYTSPFWSGATMSSDGTKLSIVDNNYGFIFVSEDSGVTWSTGGNAPTGNPNAVVVSGDGTKVYQIGDGQLYITEDFGATWVGKNLNDNGDHLLGVSSDGGVIYHSTNYFIRKSTDGGDTWIDVYDHYNNDEFMPSKMIISSDGEKIAVYGLDNLTKNTKVKVSIDSGSTWTTVINAFDVSFGNAGSVASFINDGTDLIFNLPNVVGKTTGNFTSTVKLYGDFAFGIRTDRAPTMSPLGDKIFAISDSSSEIFYRSLDGGLTWEMKSVSYEINAINMSSDGTKLYAVFGTSRFVVSTDFGDTWSNNLMAV